MIASTVKTGYIYIKRLCLLFRWSEMRDNNSKLPKPYPYNDILDRYLNEKYKIERDRKKIDDVEVANNNKKKVRILDNQIFESMANLIHFFEFVNFHSIKQVNEKDKNDHYLKGKFDDDVKDLFGIRGQHLKFHYEDDRQYVAFSRLIDGFLNYQNEEVQLQLISLLGQKLIQQIRHLAWEKDSSLFQNIILQDLGRMSFWIKYCTSGVKSDLTEPHRKIGFETMSD